jgi:glycogen phosphorylase
MRNNKPIAYFSMEFGLRADLPTYSGGLGILAGDHLKAAADLGLPLVGIGLYYHEGYFRQVIGEDARQCEYYDRKSPTDARLHPVMEYDAPRFLETGEGRLHFRVWKETVHGGELYLLDTDLPENSPEFRALTDRLYGGDRRMRLLQEYLLGVGGVLLLTKLGIEPSKIHLNEGHVAFAALALARQFEGSFAENCTRVQSHVHFTTHTPVDAGHDRFDAGLVCNLLSPFIDSCGTNKEEFLALGRHGDNSQFCMTTLSLRLCGSANGVSKLHGEVARSMWDGLKDATPIAHVTNGVHRGTWTDSRAQNMINLDDAALWKLRGKLRRDLISWLPSRVPTMLRGAESGLNPEALTIGFARRFAPYKRAMLLLEDPDRLATLLASSDRPMQFLFAGKAHPHNEPGKVLMTRMLKRIGEAPFRGKILFLENYDMELASKLVSGVDIWMNTPRRPLEASGTSGMKAALNGGLNLSVLDGWWDEAYDGSNGFAVGSSEEFENEEEQDRHDREALFKVIEERVLAEFYDREKSGLPKAWLARIRRSLATNSEQFSAERMVREYNDLYY